MEDGNLAKDTGVPSPESPLAGKRILVVDDHPDFRDILRTVLEHQKAEVTLAENGQVALDILQGRGSSQPFALILSDLSMPVMTGERFITEVRKLPDHRQTPVVVLTTHVTRVEEEKARQLGAFAVLPKDVRLNELTKTLTEAIVQSEPKNPT